MIPSPTRHLTALYAVPMALAAALYSLTVLTGNSWFTVLAGASLGLMVAAMASRPRLEGLNLCLSGAGRAAVGETVVQTLHIHNEGPRRSSALALRHDVRGLAPLRIHVDPLPPGGRAVVELSRVALSRGVTDICEIEMSTTSGIGMKCAHALAEYQHRLVVHPRSVHIAPAEHRAIRDDDLVDAVPGQGTDISGVRDWRPGDAAGSVHWRSTARRGTLVVRERALATARHVVVVMACDDTAEDWEDVIAVAAAACRAAQLAGHGLTLLVWSDGQLVAPPVQSVLALLDWWATLTSSQVPTPAALAGAVTSVGAADVLLAVSDETSEERWNELGRAVARPGGAVHRLQVRA